MSEHRESEARGADDADMPVGLCDNADCGAILDQGYYGAYDRYAKRWVWLCAECARFVREGGGDGRYGFEKPGPRGPNREEPE